MKRFLLFAFFIAAATCSFAQSYIPVDTASTVKFKIKNLGFNTGGSFSGIAGNIRFDPNNLSVCSFDVSIDANSINTGIDMRDDHLRNDDYFDVKKYPRIKFVSDKVTPSTKSGTLFLFGKLTIKEVTKDISFPFIARPQADGSYIFTGEFSINRRDFKVGGGSTLSDNVNISLEVKARKQ